MWAKYQSDSEFDEEKDEEQDEEEDEEKDEEKNEEILHYLKSRDFDNLAQFCYQNDMVFEYGSIIHDEIFYEIGDSIRCTLHRNDKQELIFGKIINIAALLLEPSIVPMVQIQEYIQKHQFDYRKFNLSDHDYGGLSEFELILDENKPWIFISDVLKLIKVMNLQEFEKTNSTQDQYFTRISISKDILKVDEKGWQFMCICKQLSNPDKGYIQCDECKNWYHDDCVEIEVQDLQDGYICSKCSHKAQLKLKDRRKRKN